MLFWIAILVVCEVGRANTLVSINFVAGAENTWNYLPSNSVGLSMQLGELIPEIDS